MAEVTLSLEEYLQLLRMAGVSHVGSARVEGEVEVKRGRIRSKRTKRVGKKDPKMARALRKANSMGRKKSGGFKKGWSQGKIMKKAHQLKRRM